MRMKLAVDYAATEEAECILLLIESDNKATRALSGSSRLQAWSSTLGETAPKATKISI